MHMHAIMINEIWLLEPYSFSAVVPCWACAADRRPLEAKERSHEDGLGVIPAARVLAEFGDAPDRYAHARARKNYAGISPVTRASGRKKIVLARYIRNRRLGDAVPQWAFFALSGSPGARACYQALRARRTGRRAVLRQLASRRVGILHGCLRNRTPTTSTSPGTITLNSAA